jgi:hypothetical protein
MGLGTRVRHDDWLMVGYELAGSTVAAQMKRNELLVSET